MFARTGGEAGSTMWCRGRGVWRTHCDACAVRWVHQWAACVWCERTSTRTHGDHFAAILLVARYAGGCQHTTVCIYLTSIIIPAWVCPMCLHPFWLRSLLLAVICIASCKACTTLLSLHFCRLAGLWQPSQLTAMLLPPPPTHTPPPLAPPRWTRRSRRSRAPLCARRVRRRARSS